MKERCKVYVTSHIPQEALDVLFEACNVGIWGSTEPVPRGELLNNVRAVDGLVCMESDAVDAEVLDAAGPKLKVIGTMSLGKNHIDEEECQRRGIQVVTLPHVPMETVADLTVASMIEATSPTNGGQGTSNNTSSSCNCVLQRDIRNATVGIIGFGKRGQAVAKKFLDMGAGRVIYNEIQPISSSPDLLATSVSFETLLEESDIVCLCCKISQNSVHRIHRDAFKMMKSSAILIDCSNGQAINYEDLYQALRNNHITAAGLNIMDTNKNFPFRKPLSGLQNFHFFPFKECNKTWDKRSKFAAAFARDLMLTLKKKHASPCPSR